MIISKTPYRISFFGGGSDYPSWYKHYGGSVLSTTIDKYLYISCRFLPPFFSHRYRIVWSKIETVNNVNQIEHNAVREMLKMFKIKKGIEVHYDGDLPARSGMGSSSSFVVGLMKGLNQINNLSLNKKELAKKSIEFEQNVLKDSVGSQDQVAASYGGFNKIDFKRDNSFVVKKILHKKNIEHLNKNLLLLYTGIERTAHDIASKYINKLKTDNRNYIIDIISYVKEGEKLLKKGDLDNFGKLLHESWLQKKALSKYMSNSEIDLIYEHSIKNGALGGKILGAGGGGFLLLYVPNEIQKKFLNKIKKYINIPFKFASTGCEIIFNRINK